jgi:hypothetical protein
MASRLFLSTAAVFLASFCLTAQDRTSAPATPEARAVAWLATEVPQWRREHPCYSCHNNGDAPRALLAAGARGFDVRAPLEDTLDWLRRPSAWNANALGGGRDDRPLMRLQFAGALTDAVERGLAGEAVLAEAADLIAADQGPDGSWLPAAQGPGSPATYGTPLATWSARRTLLRTNAARFAPRIATADAWLRAVKVVTVIDAAAVTLGLDLAKDEEARAQRARCLEILQRSEAPKGGWGPYATVASEPFDTAVVLLALATLAKDPPLAAPAFTPATLRDALARGRRYLVEQQLEDGSWVETTRPARQESYAQRVSTTAWAALALLASDSGQ